MQTPNTAMKSFRLKWWPSPQDFNEAVQTPGYTYSDEDLRAGQVELTALGLPRPQTGNFASVYRIDCINKYWAVRCFLRDIPEQQTRYNHIESTLRGLNLPFFVNFAYLAEGVRVRGDWFPILKMEWAEGPTLTEYISANLHEPDKLRQLAEEFKQLTIDLRSNGIAHGDLQHGNIIVSPAGLRLVDYDGMYVPQLAGQPSNELGHPNYQHPARKGSDFNAQLDNFSAWIIYSSLISLAEDPSLFEQLNVGDDCLLFRQKDFIQPTRSRAFALLESHPNETIRKHARSIRSLLLLPLDQIPDLGSQIVDPTNLPALAQETTSSNEGRSRDPVSSRDILVGLLAVMVALVWFVMRMQVLPKDSAHQPTTTIETGKPTSDAYDSMKAEADHYFNMGADETSPLYGIEELQHAIKLYEQLKDNKNLAYCWQWLGNKYEGAHENKKAHEAYQTALDYLKQTGYVDGPPYWSYSSLNEDIARTAEAQRLDDDDAVKQPAGIPGLVEETSAAPPLKDEPASESRIKMKKEADHYLAQGYRENSIQYAVNAFQSAIKLYEQLNDKKGLVEGWHRLGHIYADNAHDYKNAYDCFNKSLSYFQPNLFEDQPDLQSRLTGDRDYALKELQFEQDSAEKIRNQK
jgi:tetratricopeptide (TPR) repeat protein